MVKEQNIPKGWKEICFSDALEYEQPTKYLVKSTNYQKSGTPVLTAGKSFLLGYTNEKDGLYNKTPVIIFDDFTTDSKYVDFQFKVKSYAIKFLKDKGGNNLKLLYEILYSAKLVSIGGDHKRRWISDFAKRSILLPKDIQEQQKIAEVLTKVDDTITQTEQLIAKYQRIKTGLMQDLLTKGIDEHGNIRSEETHKFKDSPLGRIPVEWKASNIGDYSERLRSGVTPKGGSAIYVNEGVMLIRSQNVYPYGFKLNDVAFITEEINNKMKGSELEALDILLNITGASIGRSTFVPVNFPIAKVNQHVCAIRLKNPVIEKALFLSSYLNSDFGQNQIIQNNAGSNREGINYSQIKEIRIPKFSDNDEYTRFSNTVGSITDKIRESQEVLSKKKSLKIGLMQDLLSGKKRVTTLLKK